MVEAAKSALKVLDDGMAMDNDTIEAVAAAMFEAHYFPSPVKWSSAHAHTRAVWIKNARAAITAHLKALEDKGMAEDKQQRYGAGQGHPHGWALEELRVGWEGMNRQHVANCCFGDLINDINSLNTRIAALEQPDG